MCRIAGPFRCRQTDPRASVLDLHLIAELAEIGAFEDAYRAASPEFVAATGLTYERMGATLVISLPAFPDKTYNRVLGLGVFEPANEGMIDAALAHFAAAGVMNPGFAIAPAIEPPELTDWLHTRGLHPVDSWLKLARDAAPAPFAGTDLDVREIGPEQAGDFELVFTEGFSSPEWLGAWLTALIGREGWRIYLAYDGHVPAASGALYVKDGVGWLGFGATRPAFQRRGAQSAIMSRRLHDGIAAGCHGFTSETWEPSPDERNSSLNNMLRSGFHVVHRRLNHAFYD